MKKIDEITGRNPFRVPDNYFEGLNSRIISSASEASPVKIHHPVFARLRPYLAAAAALAVLAVIGWMTARVIFPVKADELRAEISLQEFSDTWLNDIDILTLEENAGSLLFNGEVPDVSHADIIEYLILENVDINEIYELL